MKTVKVILKVLAVLAAVAGVVYVIAAYGDKIVAWAKRLLKQGAEVIADYRCGCDCDCDCDCVCVDEAAEDAPAAVAEEVDFEG